MSVTTTQRRIVFLFLGFFAAAATAASLPSAPGYPAPYHAAFREPKVFLKPGPEFSDKFRMYQGIPSVERCSNGRLWAAWFGGGIGENKDNYIMLVTSPDSGNTWSDLKLVVDPDYIGTVPDFNPDTWPTNEQIGQEPRQNGPARVFDPCLWRDPQGRLWLFWAQERREQKNGQYRPAVLWTMVTENPEDENPIWSKPRAIAIGSMLNKPTVLTTGEWLLPVAYWKGEPSAGVIVSRDSGASFEYLGGASIFPERGRNCDEHSIIERRDGSLLMLVRGYLNKIMESVSTDRGKTWSDMHQKDADRWQLAHSNSRFFVRRLASGNLLLVKHGAIDELVKPRAKLMAFISDDDGRSWKGGLMLDDRTMVSYPDGIEGNDGNIYMIYDYERTANVDGGKSIHLAVFTEADVSAGKIVTKTSRLRQLVNQAKGINLVEYKLSENSDGDDMSEPTTRLGLATLEPLNGEVDELRNGVSLFSDQHAEAFQIPPSLLGKPFIRAPRGQVKFMVKESGLIFVLTPSVQREVNAISGQRQGYSQAESLLKNGFRKANYPETLLMFPGPDNVVSVYYKEVQAGEEMEIGEWGLVVF